MILIDFCLLNIIDQPSHFDNKSMQFTSTLCNGQKFSELTVEWFKYLK